MAKTDETPDETPEAVAEPVEPVAEPDAASVPSSWRTADEVNADHAVEHNTLDVDHDG